MKITKDLSFKLLFVLAVLLVGITASFLVYSLLCSHWTKETETNQYQKAYIQNLTQETDVNVLAGRSLKLIKAQQVDWAILTLKKAVEIQPGYRDAWVLLGYIQLLSSDNNSALESLKAAEKLDPINPKTYELLKITYEKLNDQDSAQKAEEKFEYLTKK